MSAPWSDCVAVVGCKDCEAADHLQRLLDENPYRFLGLNVVLVNRPQDAAGSVFRETHMCHRSRVSVALFPVLHWARRKHPLNWRRDLRDQGSTR